MEVSSENIVEVIGKIRNTLCKHQNGGFFVTSTFAYSDKIDRTKYKGRGRPKRTDYETYSPANLISEHLYGNRNQA